MEGVSEAYHINLGLRATGVRDTAAPMRALDRLVARHEALRTIFHSQEGEVFQKIAPEGVGFALRRQDLRGAADVEAQLRELMRAEATTSFDLAHGPLIRGCLVALSDTEHVLLVT